MRDWLLDVPGVETSVSGGGVELRLLPWVSRHLQRLFQEAGGLDERAQRPRPLRCSTQRDARLGRDRFAFGTVGLGLVGRNVMLGQRPGDPLVVEGLEVARRRDVQPPPVALRERAVRHLADESLHEAVLALLGRARIRVEREHLAPHQPAQPRERLPRAPGR